MISFASFSRYAVYIVLTVARRGDRPGLTRISERRSESSMVTSCAARSRIGAMSWSYDQRCGTARFEAMSCLTSSCATSVEVAQNGNMLRANRSS